MNDPECGNCKFWKTRSDSVGTMGGGYCRRYPPAFQEDNSVTDGWPNTHQQQWCGEWQRISRSTKTAE